MRPPARTYSRQPNLAGIAWRAASATSRPRRLSKKGSGETTSPSTCRSFRPEKASSSSRSVLASSRCNSIPRARAAAWAPSDMEVARDRVGHDLGEGHDFGDAHDAALAREAFEDEVLRLRVAEIPHGEDERPHMWMDGLRALQERARRAEQDQRHAMNPRGRLR